jgi:hypothetical protein
MPDNQMDPSATTAQFRAFVSNAEPEPERRRPVGLIVAGAVLAVVAIALVLWALL